MYQALLNKDTSFEGIFFAGIKTTGIFCRPSCTARKPKPENVEYYANASEAIRHGYRPCKVCHPMELKDATPDWLEPLLKEIGADPSIRLRSSDLRERGLQPERVSRWFKKTHGITFQAYLRMLRINQAFGQIRHGERVTDTAFSNGYESLSGFADSFKKTTGFAPAKSTNKKIITVTRLLTPLGPMMAGATDHGICLLEFTDRRMLETQISRLKKYLKAEIVSGEHSFFSMLNEQLNDYFDGKRKDFGLPLDLTGTAFQQQVWTELLQIPYGKTRSYKEQATNIGNPKAVRAVARANGDNRISIIIPCHRVIGSDGELTGYGGGLWRKKWLLEHEQNSKLKVDN
ncbi:MAG: methylated-DNA--[protein]-cysteine S-methyltransferase [Bacteroidetes bacterium]|nr:methylated-DNA--[protein]-cysteine S-methyltransferase [Bacteroidota bacterium]